MDPHCITYPHTYGHRIRTRIRYPFCSYSVRVHRRYGYETCSLVIEFELARKERVVEKFVAASDSRRGRLAGRTLGISPRRDLVTVCKITLRGELREPARVWRPLLFFSFAGRLLGRTGCIRSSAMQCNRLPFPRSVAMEQVVGCQRG